MKYKAILAQTTTDKIRSKILSPMSSELVLEVYMTPEQFAKIVTNYSQKEFGIEFHD